MKIDYEFNIWKIGIDITFFKTRAGGLTYPLPPPHASAKNANKKLSERFKLHSIYFTWMNCKNKAFRANKVFFLRTLEKISIYIPIIQKKRDKKVFCGKFSFPRGFKTHLICFSS